MATTERQDTYGGDMKALSDFKDSKLDWEEWDSTQGTDPNYKFTIKWNFVSWFVLFHVMGAYGLVLFFYEEKRLLLLVTFLILFVFANIGVTGGTHRLWSHRAFKAKTPLKILLMLMQTSSFQNSAIYWCRDHKLHHKYVDTDGDPHNATRGFFFSHMGWLMVEKHPLVIKFGKEVDMEYLWNEPVLKFQHQHYYKLAFLMNIVVPMMIGKCVLGVSLAISFFFLSVFRFVLVTQISGLVNSAAHMFGNRPYDESICPTENEIVSFLAGGEGFHNYHHTFPWDYAASELGTKLNITTAFIDLMAKIGWAYDLKTTSKELIAARMKRTGPKK